MRIAQTATYLTAASLYIASGGTFGAAAQAAESSTMGVTGFTGVASAWSDSGAAELDDDQQLAAGARAITPTLDFAGQAFPVTTVAPSGSFFPLSEQVMLGFDVGAAGPALQTGSRNLYLAPSLAYSFNDRLLFSVGLDTGYFDSVRGVRAGQYSGCVALEAAGALPLFTCSDAIRYAPINLAGTRAGSVEADGTGYGYNLGATFTLGADTRLGMRYRSGMSLNVEDETVFHTAGPLLSTDLVRLTDQAAIAGLGLPESFAVGASHQFNERWSLAGDVTWVNWSEIERLRIASGEGTAGAQRIEDWENTYRYTLGLNYRHSEQWKYRLGAAYDQSPISTMQAGAARLPGEDLVWVALGVGFSPTPRLSLDVGYARPFLMDPQLYNGLQHNLAGQFEGEGDILSAQFKWRFE